MRIFEALAALRPPTTARTPRSPARPPDATEGRASAPPGTRPRAHRGVHRGVRSVLLAALLLAGLPAPLAGPAPLLPGGTVLAQGSGPEQHNGLAVDGVLAEEAGPYYFIAWGDSANAYALAAPFAEALGATLDYDAAAKTLSFRRGGTEVTLRATGDPNEGLADAPGAMTVDGRARDSFLAILMDGTSYVPITPIVDALGGESSWHSEPRLIMVEMPPETGTAPAAPIAADTGAPAPGGGPVLPRFRTGVHDGYTRVALDLPPEQRFTVAVRERALVVSFPGARSPGGAWETGSDQLERAAYGTLDGDAALILQARHDLAPDGSGYRFGTTGSGVLYVDVGPALRGEAAATLLEPAEAPREPTAAAPAAPIRPVVVLDPGHGGRFAGAQGYAPEEDVNLAVALRVRDLLQAEGVEVVMTRESDVHLANSLRADLNTRAGFATPDRNLFVSIHSNSADAASANGIETFVFGRTLDPDLINRAIEENGAGELGIELTSQATAVAAEIDGDILREAQLNHSLDVAEIVQSRLVAATGARDRGVKQNVLYVLRNARTPAVLIELGFVSHPDEGRRLGQTDYQEVLARAIAGGVLDFLRP